MPKPKPTGPTKSTLRTLAQFVRDQRRAGCPVCALPAVVRGQLADATAKKIPLQWQLDWLRAEHRATVTDQELIRHRSARHEQT